MEGNHGIIVTIASSRTSHPDFPISRDACHELFIRPVRQCLCLRMLEILKGYYRNKKDAFNNKLAKLFAL
jgi:hypothetical protein